MEWSTKHQGLEEVSTISSRGWRSSNRQPEPGASEAVSQQAEREAEEDRAEREAEGLASEQSQTVREREVGGSTEATIPAKQGSEHTNIAEQKEKEKPQIRIKIWEIGIYLLRAWTWGTYNESMRRSSQH